MTNQPRRRARSRWVALATSSLVASVAVSACSPPDEEAVTVDTIRQDRADDPESFTVDTASDTRDDGSDEGAGARSAQDTETPADDPAPDDPAPDDPAPDDPAPDDPAPDDPATTGDGSSDDGAPDDTVADGIVQTETAPTDIATVPAGRGSTAAAQESGITVSAVDLVGRAGQSVTEPDTCSVDIPCSGPPATNGDSRGAIAMGEYQRGVFVPEGLVLDVYFDQSRPFDIMFQLCVEMGGVLVARSQDGSRWAGWYYCHDVSY